MNHPARHLLPLLLSALLAGCATPPPADPHAAELERTIVGVWENTAPIAAAAPGQVRVRIRPHGVGVVELAGDLRFPLLDAPVRGFRYELVGDRVFVQLGGELRQARLAVRADELVLRALERDPVTGELREKSPLRLRRSSDRSLPRVGRQPGADRRLFDLLAHAGRR